MKKQTLLAVTVVFLAVICAAGAAWTLIGRCDSAWHLARHFRLFRQLSDFAGVTVAAIILPFRRDSIERTTLLCAVVAAGSSAVFGLGFRSTTLDVVRLLFHFLTYTLGIMVCVRWLVGLWRRTSSVRAA
jgi:hypothetical protein